MWGVGVLERFNADVVYSEAGVGCGGVGGAMSVGFVLYQRQLIRCQELSCWNKWGNWLGRRPD